MITYLICGMIFSTLFHYDELFRLGNTQYFMREFGGTSSMIGPAIQIVRGILLGIVLWVIKDAYWGKPYAWLRVWVLLVGIGIICTPGPAPCSLEGIIYTQLPMEVHIKGAPEIWVQTLLFSIWITKDIKIKKEVKISIIVTVMACVFYILGGVLLSLVLGQEVDPEATEPIAYGIMFLALGITYFMTNRYLKGKLGSGVYYGGCYLALTGMPILFNFLTHNPMFSPLSFIFSGIPVVVIGIYLKLNQCKGVHKEVQR